MNEYHPLTYTTINAIVTTLASGSASWQLEEVDQLTSSPNLDEVRIRFRIAHPMIKSGDSRSVVEIIVTTRKGQ